MFPYQFEDYVTISFHIKISKIIFYILIIIILDISRKLILDVSISSPIPPCHYTVWIKVGVWKISVV